MTTWLISANPEKYDHDLAFKKYGFIDWEKKGNYEINEIVYIITSKHNQILKYKTKVVAQNLKYVDTFNDDEFWKNTSDIRRPDDTTLYSRLELVNSFEDERLALSTLRVFQNNLNPPEKSKKLSGSLLGYINRIFEEHIDTEIRHSAFISKRNRKHSIVSKQEFIDSLELRDEIIIQQFGTSNTYYIMIDGICFAALELRKTRYTLRTKENHIMAIGEKNYQIDEWEPGLPAMISNIPFDDKKVLYTLFDYIAESRKNVLDFEQEQYKDESLEISYAADEHQLKGFDRQVFAKARVNQGVFRDRLIRKYKKCCLCGVDDKILLIASHIRPWTKSEEGEKIDENNGLLLCPNHDKLFDGGLISFDDEGCILISMSLSEKNRELLNVSSDIKIEMNETMAIYMGYHRRHIYMDH